MTGFSPFEASIADLQEAMRDGRTSARELVEHYLARIAAFDASGPALNAVRAVNENALAIADGLDAERRQRGPRGTLHGMPIVSLAFEFNFHGGSMGYAVGEKFTRAAQLALEEKIPLVCFSASGGARMQEALISLMQMAKTSALIERMKLDRVPYVSVMIDPI